jgi:uncharacterized protein (DUF1330 family)
MASLSPRALDVTDPERYERYKAVSPLAIAVGGGRFLVRGGELVVLEGVTCPGVRPGGPACCYT